jgi:hypothetical protein
MQEKFIKTLIEFHEWLHDHGTVQEPTINQVRQKAMNAVENGKASELQQLIAEFEIDKFSAIPRAKMAEFNSRLEELK